MRRRAIWTAVAVACLAVGSAVGGEIHLKVTPADRVDMVYAIDRLARGWPKPKHGGERRDDLWVVPNLAPGYYDLYISTDDGVVEGANMKIINEIDEEEVPGKDAPELTEAGRKALADYCMKTKIWENNRRILAIAGHARRACVLIEKLMTADTSLPSDQPQLFWRPEVWHFENHYGGWVKIKRTIVLERERLPVATWETLRYRFVPALGGLHVQTSEPLVVEYQLPDEWPEPPAWVTE